TKLHIEIKSSAPWWGLVNLSSVLNGQIYKNQDAHDVVLDREESGPRGINHRPIKSFMQVSTIRISSTPCEFFTIIIKWRDKEQ
ncbi:hypothetical protein TorRG33x02_341790, partial [Trema orientale]